MSETSVALRSLTGRRSAGRRPSPGTRRKVAGRSSVIRSGLTLYEVVLSLTIFGGAIAVLTQAISTGTRAAVESRLQTQATLWCETKLSEVVAGIEPLEPVDAVPIAAGEEPSSNWFWSLSMSEGPLPELLLLEVRVMHQSESGLGSVEHSLTRLLRDPQFTLTDSDTGAAASN